MKPLAGRTVLVTRPADQSVELVRRLRRLGAAAIVAPTIEIAVISERLRGSNPHCRCRKVGYMSCVPCEEKLIIAMSTVR